MALTEADLLREVAKVQRDKTLQAVRDLIEGIKVSDYSTRSYSDEPRPAAQFKSELLDGIKAMVKEEGA